MMFHEMTPPQAQDGRMIGAEATLERMHVSGFEEDVFVNTVEKNHSGSDVIPILDMKDINVGVMHFFKSHLHILEFNTMRALTIRPNF